MGVAHLDVDQLVRDHRPDVIVFDVAAPYESNWDFLEMIRLMPALEGIPVVVTTSNKRELERLIGPTAALEITAGASDFDPLLAAVEGLY